MLRLLMAFCFLLKSSFPDSHGYVRYIIRKPALTLNLAGGLTVANETLGFDLGPVSWFPTSMRFFYHLLVLRSRVARCQYPLVSKTAQVPYQLAGTSNLPHPIRIPTDTGNHQSGRARDSN